MIQDTNYRRVNSSGLNKVGVVALVGVVAAIGIFAVSYTPKTQTQAHKTILLPKMFSRDVKSYTITKDTTTDPYSELR